jgi:hypothetical protein
LKTITTHSLKRDLKEEEKKFVEGGMNKSLNKPRRLAFVFPAVAPARRYIPLVHNHLISSGDLYIFFQHCFLELPASRGF